MGPTLLSLLDSIPQKPPRSKLETQRELIRQLRRKSGTYRDIVRNLQQRVAVASTWQSARFTPSSRFAPHTESRCSTNPHRSNPASSVSTRRFR
jgi:hypothetical protein